MTERTRLHFEAELSRLEEQALGAFDLVMEAIERTGEAVQEADIELAELVIADDDRMDGRYLEVHQSVLSLLAREAPVASDLRLIAALLDVIKHLERMGDQCVNICKLLPLAGHEPPSHPVILAKIGEMATCARSQV
jgi:phosphate transport system protein